MGTKFTTFHVGQWEKCILSLWLGIYILYLSIFILVQYESIGGLHKFRAIKRVGFIPMCVRGGMTHIIIICPISIGKNGCL